MMKTRPFFTVVTIVYNDVWALSKTMRSVMLQSFKDFQYIILDGDSQDGVERLIEFWSDFDLVDLFKKEKDDGVYDAMNKAVEKANGDYILFMNAGDVFSSNNELQVAFEALSIDSMSDGILGWGQLKNQIWTSWHVESDAVRMSSLGFCHQSLYLRKHWLERFPFDSRPNKTDSDTKQLADSIAAGAQISILNRVMSIRSPSDGLSANLELTKESISETIVRDYRDLTQDDATKIIDFRRTCVDPTVIIDLLERIDGKAQHDLAITVLDTLYLKQAKPVNDINFEALLKTAISCLETGSQKPGALLWRLQKMLQDKLRILTEVARNQRLVAKEGSEIEASLWGDNAAAISWDNTANCRVTFTTFPARVTSLHLVLQSIFKQTMPPKEIFLVVGRDEFKNEWTFPKEVLEFKKSGLMIHFVDKTSHQYDKFLHTYDSNRQIPFLLIDDDVIYPPTTIEKLVKASDLNPHCVIANRCHRITFNNLEALDPYEKWDREVFQADASHSLFATGAGGVLYPAGFFSEIQTPDSILNLCPYADDVWLKGMSLRYGYKVKTTQSAGESWKLGYTPTMLRFALHEGNVDFGLNDEQINKTMDWLSAEGIDWRAMMRDQD